MRFLRLSIGAAVALCLLSSALTQTAAAPKDKPKAKTVTGKVVGGSDGDSLTLLVAKKQYKIRLAGIDCPESRQAFGTKAKQAL